METIALHPCMRITAMAYMLRYSQRHRLLSRSPPQYALSCQGKKQFQSPRGAENNPQHVSRICCTSSKERPPMKLSGTFVCDNIVRSRLFSCVRGNIDSFHCVQMHTRAQYQAYKMSQDAFCVIKGKQLSSHVHSKCSEKRRKFSSKDDVSQRQTDSLLDEDSHDKLDLSVVSVDIASVAQEVIASLSEMDKMVLSIPQQKVETVVHILLKEGMTSDQVKELLLEKPSLLKHNKLKQILSLLKSYDLVSLDMFKVLMSVENLAHLRETNIKNVFDALRVVGMRDGKLQELIVSEPAVLGLDGRSIQDRVSKLKMMFKTEDVLRVMVKTPIVLICDWGELEEKFHYVSDEMKVSQRQMMYSHLFAHTQDHVKCRHQFLIRAGLFSMDQQAKNSNPRLQDIIDTSDADFVKRFGGMHIDEYRTFCKLMAKSDILEE